VKCEGVYELLDCGNGQKLEQVGPYRFVRPASQAVWSPSLPASEWNNVDGVYTRFSGGNGKWKFPKKRPKDEWAIDMAGVGFINKMTDFGHLGIFAEQLDNWKILQEICAPVGDRKLKVLNLFAYTGGSSLAAARGGAEVTHLDASKTSVAWGRENQKQSGLDDAPIRWITDDVQKFVTREIKRGNKYEGIILDPPSFGRGTKNELWKIEEHLPALLSDLEKLKSDDFKFILLSAHSNGFTPVCLKNLLKEFTADLNGRYEMNEMLIRQKNSDVALPSGACCWFIRD
jgi:23S rRNA (cytosine1962-C5)-methyltransferase